ncbi:arf-GAP with Rho-GAP domain, ANK repeat and PH domain-containing protein 1 isoform X2 [Denticeps clupeoides]|uniref:arf-GAP with Rho-GAP domain, ANK repeat and PH domain-containing protein 1 isoform X2 n=1 Tax=Denticeps clupeoides TaxID=299321 RepID=UPI0010A535C6|nr:arf-GAP with Rho-GAP domain, ANK repeat and PH domain-containing protein 1-like isoform X2 [Denticeps clupeoides]
MGLLCKLAKKMSLQLGEEVTTPVPKPRTRYRKGFVTPKRSESESVWYDPGPGDVKGEVMPDAAANGLCTTSEDPNAYKVDFNTRWSLPTIKFSWPVLPHQSPSLDDKAAGDSGKDNVSDSSNEEEVPSAPDSPKSDDDIIDCKQAKPQQQKTPRAATIRVSRKKQGLSGTQVPSAPKESVVSRSSWLDVWKGRKHNVLWATLDGQLMSLWKKRNDKFPEQVFHVSSITSVRKQDKGRFSIYFGKKHFEFMALNDDVLDGWVTSLHATRGTEPPALPIHQGQLVMKDPRTKVYAAIYGHNLWIFSKKEDFSLGIGMTLVSMNVASVKKNGRSGFSLITPYKTFNFSAESRDLGAWLECLNKGIMSALSCSDVAKRLWTSPWNKVCGDCGAANPEWASINLLLIICEACAGQHRAIGSNRSKVRSLTLDSKVWTEPLIQLFEVYGNKAANEVWGYNIPAAEQILQDASPNERAAFIKAKYVKGCYRRSHPLASNKELLNKRLCQVVCGSDVPETLSLICSGARVLNPTGEGAIIIAERAEQALQVELLRHNEYIEMPDWDHVTSSKDQSGLEELHGKLEDDRFLFSLENDSAACDVLDLREVIYVFNHSKGSSHNFTMLTLTETLVCDATTEEALLAHLMYILKVILPDGVRLWTGELDGVFAAARVLLLEEGGLQHREVWVTMRAGEIYIYPTDPQKHRERLVLSTGQQFKLNTPAKTVEIMLGERTVCLQFEREIGCTQWHAQLVKALSSVGTRSQRQSLYQLPASVCGSVPPAVQRCISHITQHGLKVEGLYRRCGIASKVTQLAEALKTSPTTTTMGTDEQGVLDVGSTLKLLLRNGTEIIPRMEREHWVKASVLPEETFRIQAYIRLVKQLSPDNRATLSELCGHLYFVQVYSQENRMTAQNLALVFVPVLFEELAMNIDMVRLTKELIVHHTLIFLRKEEEPKADRTADKWDGDRDEMVTFL